MANKQRQRVIVVILVLAVIFLTKSVWGVWRKNALARSTRNEAAAELTDLQNRHRTLADRVKRLATPQGEEEELRRNFPVAKEGERVVVIVDERSSGTASSSESWWDKIFNRE